MKKYLAILSILIMTMGLFNSTVNADERHVLSGNTKLIFVIPQDSTGVVMWTRAAWVNANYFESVTSVYAAGQRYTTSSKRSVYGDIDMVYDGEYSVSPLFTVNYTTSTMSHTTSALTKIEATIGAPNSVSRYDDTIVNLTGNSPKGSTTVFYSVPYAIVPMKSVTVSLDLD